MKLLVLLFFFPIIVFANSDCSQHLEDCEYYTCVANAKHCGRGTYPASFGRHFCLLAQNSENMVSHEGKLWIQETRRCLIREMSTFEDPLTCGELWSRAFKSHVPCYVQNGFCQLPFRDKTVVLKLIWPSIRNVYVLANGINILRACY